MATYDPPYQHEPPSMRQRRAKEGFCLGNPKHGSVLYCADCWHPFEMDGPWDAKKYRDTLCSGCGRNPKLKYRMHCKICWDPIRRAKNEERGDKKKKQQRESRAELKKKNQCECRMDCPRKGKRCFFRVFNEALTPQDAVEAIAEHQWKWILRHIDDRRCLRILAIRIAVQERIDNPKYLRRMKQRGWHKTTDADIAHLVECIRGGNMDMFQPLSEPWGNMLMAAMARQATPNS